MTTTLTILGCGSSGGVPRLGQGWGACDPANPRNRRRRASALLRRTGAGGTTSVLIDTSPDVREQLLDVGVHTLDGVVFTHDHADHTHGIDDLRMVAFSAKRRVDVYMDAPTGASLISRFAYCFKGRAGSAYPPILEAHPITVGTPIRIDGAGGPIELLPLDQEHGDIRSLGLRIGRVAYSSDASGFPAHTQHHLRGLDTWIVGALRYIPHPAHFTVKQALTWIDRFRPKRAVLTHMHIDLDYAALTKELPDRVEPAYDGMVITIAGEEAP